jgi:hypothetical protein
MMFAIVFLILGTLFVIIPISNRIAIPTFAVLSLTPAALSFFYGQ